MLSDLTYCDFLVFAPLDLEIDALENALKHLGWQVNGEKNPLFPRILYAHLNDSDSAYSIRTCVLVQLNFQGVLNASVDAARALEYFEPGYVVSFGIAGSLNSQDAPIGSVVWATSLVYYEPSKDIQKRTQSRFTPVPLGKTLLNYYRQAPLIKFRRLDGPIASGEKLFADVESKDRLRILAVNDKTLCVEMESAGVAAATASIRPSSEVLIIKGISDYSDKAKNTASKNIQAKNRLAAATNAAMCLSHLASKAPLRRAFRSLPSFEELREASATESEAELLVSTLATAGIRCKVQEVYSCLIGRRSPVPLYYHWKQLGPHLNWIDFKILLAIRSLPRSVITPVPIVTLNDGDVRIAEPWFDTVQRLLGVTPTTDRDLRRQQEELTSHAQRIGFSSRIEDDIRADLMKEQKAGTTPILLNIMRFMLGQLCHRRFFVFAWRNTKNRWQHLSRALGISFAIFDWDAITLDGADGKRSLPGSNILIDPPHFEFVRRWADGCGTPSSLLEFVRHFDADFKDSDDPRHEIDVLLESWSRLFAKH